MLNGSKIEAYNQRRKLLYIVCRCNEPRGPLSEAGAEILPKSSTH